MTQDQKNIDKSEPKAKLAVWAKLEAGALSSNIESGKYDIASMAGRICALTDAIGSTTALARAADVSEGLVRKWRKGTSEPKISDLRRAAQEVGVSACWLMLGEGEPMAGGRPQMPVIASYKGRGDGDLAGASSRVTEMLEVDGRCGYGPVKARYEKADYVSLARAVKIVETLVGRPVSQIGLGELATQIESVYRQLNEVSDS